MQLMNTNFPHDSFIYRSYNTDVGYIYIYSILYNTNTFPIIQYKCIYKTV